MKLIKISASWCNPCKMQSEEFKRNPLDIEIQEIDIDTTDPAELNIIQQLRVMSVPTLILLNDKSEVVARWHGFTTSHEIKKAIKLKSAFDYKRFVIIEDFNGSINLVIDPETGNTLVFEDPNEAFEEAKKCQNGKVVGL